ncbi:MAG: ATP phosphoribosyltransferase regulatory subunit [Neomegalonema sp.]|nr:ATP phosphoribosyltransferase regulatory subunit [Neomegalonema sp.]
MDAVEQNAPPPGADGEAADTVSRASASVPAQPENSIKTIGTQAGETHSGAHLGALSMVNQELMSVIASAGFEPIEPAIVLPAEPLYDLYGEDLLERAFTFEDPQAGSLCMRPDFTAPVAQAHLSAHGPHASGRYGYFGPVFRRSQSTGGAQPIQHLQAGFEIIGDQLDLAAEVEVFELTGKALRWAGCEHFETVTGDLNVMFSLLDALAMPENWRARLKRHFRRPARFSALLHEFGGDAEGSAGMSASRLAFLKALGAMAPDQAAAALSETMALSQIPHTGIRSAEEIAERMLRQAGEAREHPLPQETIAIIESAMAVRGPAPAALIRLRDIAQGAGVAISPALDRLSARLDEISARGIDLLSLPFDASYGRNLDFYDGFVFEMTGASPEGPVRLAGGGHYSALFKALGAPGLMGIGAGLRSEAIAFMRAEQERMAAQQSGAGEPVQPWEPLT